MAWVENQWAASTTLADLRYGKKQNPSLPSSSAMWNMGASSFKIKVVSKTNCPRSWGSYGGHQQTILKAHLKQENRKHGEEHVPSVGWDWMSEAKVLVFWSLDLPCSAGVDNPISMDVLSPSRLSFLWNHTLLAGGVACTLTSSVKLWA